VEADVYVVYVWRYALLVVHSRKEEEEESNLIHIAAGITL